MTQIKYLAQTKLLDFKQPNIQKLINDRKWRQLNEYDRIGAAYDFVRNEIMFGYNRSDDLAASEVLDDGYGQCNTKGTLLMALLRELGIQCRFHGFTIDNALQKGAIPSYLFFMAPKYILHSWVEVDYQGNWVDLEGFILDQSYLSAIQRREGGQKGPYKGYAVATKCLLRPAIQWEGLSTYIQKEGIHDDFGVFDNPDEFYFSHGTNLSGVRKVLYQLFFRHLINWNVRAIRRE